MYCAVNCKRGFENIAHGSFYIFRKKEDVSCVDSNMVSVNDYYLAYGGSLLYDMSVEKLIKEFEGFYVSVTDVIVMVYKNTPSCYYVEPFDFSPAYGFFDALKDECSLEVAFSIADRFVTFQPVTDGYEYNVFDNEYHLIDGGVYDEPDMPYFAVVDEIIRDLQKPVFEFSTGKFILNPISGCMSDCRTFLPVDADMIFEQSLRVLEEEKKEHAAVRVFRSKTAEKFVPIEGLCVRNIESMVIRHATQLLSEFESELKTIRLVGCVLSGSRCRGLESEDSDIDVVLEYRGDIKESVLFNLLNGENQININGVPVDINPIRKEETGTLATYLPGVERYLLAKPNKGAL